MAEPHEAGINPETLTSGREQKSNHRIHAPTHLKSAGDMYQEYSRSELIADGIIHAVGICVALIGIAAMMTFAFSSSSPPTIASLAIYGAGVLLVFGCSAAYHMLPRSDWKQSLRRFDQAAIFLKIAGTYTPFAVVKLGGLTGAVLLSSVWAVALFAAARKLLGRQSRDALDIGLYLALGWAGLAVFGPLSAAVTAQVLMLLVLGGILYSLGVVFHLWSTLKYQNAIWHGFVLAGTCCHFGAVNAAAFS
jgi:hemolysin III